MEKVTNWEKPVDSRRSTTIPAKLYNITKALQTLQQTINELSMKSCNPRVSHKTYLISYAFSVYWNYSS